MGINGFNLANKNCHQELRSLLLERVDNGFRNVVIISYIKVVSNRVRLALVARQMIVSYLWEFHIYSLANSTIVWSETSEAPISTAILPILAFLGARMIFCNFKNETMISHMVFRGGTHHSWWLFGLLPASSWLQRHKLLVQFQPHRLPQQQN